MLRNKVERARREIVKYARKQIGCAYDTRPSGYVEGLMYNCSGLTYCAYKAAGLEIPTYQGAQNGSFSQSDMVRSVKGWKWNSANLQPGDLVFWSHNGDPFNTYHVGIYTGDYSCISANGVRDGVIEHGVHYDDGFVNGGFPFTIEDDEGDEDMKPCFINIKGRNTTVYLDWCDVHDCTDPEDLRIMNKVYKEVHGEEIKSVTLEPAEFARIAQTLRSDWPKHLQDILKAYPSRSPKN